MDQHLKHIVHLRIRPSTWGDYYTIMKYNFTILTLVVSLVSLVRTEESDRSVSKRGVEEHVSVGGGGSLVSQHVEIVKEVPVVHYHGIAVPVPHPVGVPVHVPIHVPEPVPVQIPYPFPVYQTVHVPVEKPVPVEVEKPYPVEVIEKVPVAIPKPYPVHVPVYRIKHIYHGETLLHPEKHGWF